MRDVNQETITSTLSWYKILPLNGFNFIRTKQKLHRKPREDCKISWSPIGILKSFTPTTHWNLENPVKIYHGLHRSETNVIAERAVRREKRRYFSSGATIRIVRKMVVWFYELLLLSAKCPRPRGRWENSQRKTVWRTIQRANDAFWSNGWISSDFSERCIKNSSTWQESITWYLSWIWADRWRNLERRYSDCRFTRFGKVGRIRNLSLKNRCERSIDITKGRRTQIPSSRWYSKIAWERLRFPRTHSKAGTNRKEWRSQWRTSRRTGGASTDRSNRSRWSPCRLLVDPRWLHHNEPRVQLYVPKEETFLIPLKYIDVTRSTHTDLDVMQETTYWRLLECRFKQTLFRFVERIHEIHSIERNTSQGFLWSWRRLTKVRTTTRPDHTWPEVWAKIGEAAQNREKHEWNNEKPKVDNARRLRGIYFIDLDDEEYKETLKNARRKSKTDRNLLHWSGWRRIQGNPQKCEEKIEKAEGRGHAVQNGDSL